MGWIRIVSAGLIGCVALLQVGHASAQEGTVGPGATLEAGQAESSATVESIDYQALALLYRQGRTALNQDDYVTAEMAADAILDQDPMYADALVLRGQINRARGGQRTAYDHYDAALQVDPDHALAKSYLGQLFLDIGRLDRAKSYMVSLDAQCPFGCGASLLLARAIADFEAGRWAPPMQEAPSNKSTE